MLMLLYFLKGTCKMMALNYSVNGKQFNFQCMYIDHKEISVNNALCESILNLSLFLCYNLP